MKPKEGVIRKIAIDIKEKKQMKKYIAVTTASFMAMQLAACGNTETRTVEETTNTNNVTEENNTSTSGDGLQSVYDSDMANSCEKWEESDDGSFECLDENSPYYAHHFFNGLMYATTGAMIGSAIYKSRNLRNGTNANSNGITTNGSQNPTGTTSSSTNSNTSGSKSYSSGKRSYSNSSNSYSNHSSSSTGKSGFGSGGASRGGSSSS